MFPKVEDANRDESVVTGTSKDESETVGESDMSSSGGKMNAALSSPAPSGADAATDVIS